MESTQNISAPEKRSAGWTLALLGFIFLAAFLLRTCGLSNDLDRGIIYHPDTPKQVQAAMRFLSGDFYVETGNRDYDGYPYFSSQIAAGIYRVYLPLHSRALHHLGLHTASPPDTWLTLFWIIRLWNSLISALSVLLIYFIGRRVFGCVAGLLASTLLAIFPLDIASSHYAMSDPSAAFFALIAVWFALNIYEKGRYRDYILATLFAVCAFSAKYNGVVSAVPVMLAHILRQSSLKSLWQAASIKRILAMALTAPLVFIATTPASWEAPTQAIPQILAFLDYTSNFKVDEQIAQLSFFAKAVYSFALNGPAIASIFTLPILMLAGIQLILAFKHKSKETWIILAMPILYLIAGLLFKPVLQSTYHTLISPLLILLACGTLSTLLRNKKAYFALPVLAVLSLGFGGVKYAHATAQHLFYFQHNDARVVTAEWLKKNVPETFRVEGGRYAYVDQKPYYQTLQTEGLIWVSTDTRENLNPDDPIIETVTLYDDGFEFRNYPSRIVVENHPWIQADHTPIHLQKLPSTTSASLIPLDLNYYLSSPLLIRGEGKSLRTFLSETPLTSALVAYKSGETGNQVTLTLGGQSTHLSVHQSTDVKLLQGLKPDFPRLSQGYAYTLKMDTLHKNGLLQIAFTPLEKGLLYYDLGDLQKAAETLQEIDHPTAKLIHFIAAHQSQSGEANFANLPQAFQQEGPLTPEDIRELYGIAPEYIDDLPAIRWSSGEFILPKKQRLIFEPTAENDTAVVLSDQLETPVVYLQEGIYKLELSVNLPVSGDHPIEVSTFSADPEETIWSSSLPISDPTGKFMTYSMTFTHKGEADAVYFRIERKGGSEVLIDNVSIRPDTTASLNRLKDIVHSLPTD